VVASCGGSGSSDGVEGEWVGDCTLPAAPVLGMDVDIDVVLRDVVFEPDSEIQDGSGEWNIWAGSADLTEGGSTSTSQVLIFRCLSVDGCSNQGDPYQEGETLFNVKTSSDVAQEVIMKGTQDPDDISSYSGICQSRREGLTLTGSFTLTHGG
jgi:hypothetical protein